MHQGLYTFHTKCVLAKSFQRDEHTDSMTTREDVWSRDFFTSRDGGGGKGNHKEVKFRGASLVFLQRETWNLLEVS